jgi:superfamily II DNA or RNA helicase
MTKKMELYQHQQRIVNLNPNKVCLIWETGTGKSFAGIELANSKGHDALYIVPKGLKKKWQRDLSTYSQVSPHLMTKEEFRKDFANIPRYNTIVVDEAHYFFGKPKTTQMARALHLYIKQYQPENIYLLTATVYRSNPMDVFYMLKLLGREPSYGDFQSRFFNQQYMYGRVFNVPRTGPNVAKELAQYAKSAADVVALDECVDVPEQQFLTEYIELHRDQKKAIRKMQLEYPEPIQQYTQEHRICGGTRAVDEYSDDDPLVKSLKTDRLIELAEENKKMIVVCRYNDEIYMLYDILKNKLDRPVRVINGDVVGDERQDILDYLNKEDEYILLVNAAVSEGWELDCAFMVFYSYSFSLKDYVQMIGRIKRINNLHKNVYISLVVENTIDEAVYKNIVEKKMDFHLEIYAKENAN